jgi:hypothetical protein
MSTKHTPGPASDRFDPMLTNARKIIQKAIVEHCGTGADIEMVAADAAQQILGEIAQQAMHRFPNFTPGPWKRMPPDLRAAIARATGESA